MATDKQTHLLEALKALDHHPTVRSLTDHMETKKYKSERFTDDEVRGLLERMVDQGLVSRYAGEHGEVRYQVTLRATEPDSAA